MGSIFIDVGSASPEFRETGGRFEFRFQAEFDREIQYLIDDDQMVTIENYLHGGSATEQDVYNVLVDAGIDEWYLSQGYVVLPESMETMADIPAPLPAPRRIDIFEFVGRLRAADNLRRTQRLIARRKRALQMVATALPDDCPLRDFDVSLNANENCAGYLLGNAAYTGETVQDFIDYCADKSITNAVYDAVGRVINVEFYPECKKGVYAMATRGHMYPLNNPVSLRKKSPESDKKLIKVSQGVTHPETLEMMRQISALQYYDIKDTADLFCVDGNHWYYEMSQITAMVGLPSINDVPTKYTNQRIKDFCMYSVKGDIRKYGFTTNVMLGRTVKLLMKHVDITIEYVVDYKSSEIFDSKACVTDDNKAFINNVGVWGKVRSHRIQELKGIEQKEMEMLKCDMDGYSGSIYNGMYQKNFINHANRKHLQVHIIDMANYKMLETMLSIAETQNLMPVRIKTDSLTYTTKIPIPKGFKIETPNSKGVMTPFKEYNHKQLRFANECVQGKAGSGKSYLCARKPHDIATAYTNKKAKDIGGVTLSTLFDSFKRGSLAHLEDKIVWIDECFMIPAEYWGMLLDSYVNWNTRFIFSGDSNQLGPVKGSKVSDTCSFFGDVEVLTTEHRCDVETQQVRDNIADYQPNFSQDSDYPLQNLCYYNKTKHSINMAIAEGISLDSIDARVISNKNTPDFHNGQTMTVLRKHDKYVETTAGNITLKKLFGGGKSPNFSFGYCQTTHKAQGDTLEGIVGVHDYQRMSDDMKLTVVSRVRSVSQLMFFR